MGKKKIQYDYSELAIALSVIGSLLSFSVCVWIFRPDVVMPIFKFMGTAVKENKIEIGKIEKIDCRKKESRYLLECIEKVNDSEYTWQGISRRDSGDARMFTLYKRGS